MSSSELRRQSKQVKTLCAACQERKAKFRFRRAVRADRDHTLCFECYRSEVNRTRARRLADATSRWAKPSLCRPSDVSGGRVLDDRQIAHRQRMLDHRRRRSSMAS